MGRHDRTIDQRMTEKIDRRGANDCWPWIGSVNQGGYGRIKVTGRVEAAHRVAFRLAHGAIADGLLVCHRCDNPRCCNPAHLFLGTDRDNAQDRARKGRGNQGRQSVNAGVLNRAAKLDDDAVRTIRRMRADTGATHRAIATAFGVSPRTVGEILSGAHWRSVG